MRITIDGQISEISTKRTVLPSKLNSQAQSVKWSSEDCKSLNFILRHLSRKFMILIKYKIKKLLPPEGKKNQQHYLR